MQFDSLADFFAMGGHALYVWLAYGASVAILGINFFSVRSALQTNLKNAEWQHLGAHDQPPANPSVDNRVDNEPNS